MYVSVKHTVADAAAFQARGQALVQGAPAGLTPLQFFPDTQGREAACLWEGESVEAVAEYIDGTLGDASKQDYFQIAEEYATGLPVRR